MMPDPQSYVESIKDYPYRDLIKEKDELVRDIRKLERQLFNNQDKEQIEIRYPSPDVEYQVYLEYLSALTAYMSKRYNEEFE